jgi:hypothetical protein
VTTHLKELAAEYRRRGAHRFFEEYPASSVLIGMGIIGELRDRGRSASGTFVFKPGEDISEYMHSASLVGRVWFLVKKPENRKELRIVVGRTAEADVAIPEFSISVEHCAFTASAFGLQLSDLGSTNGTIVNGRLLQRDERVSLRSGSKIVLGRFEFQYLLHKDFVRRLRSETKSIMR